MLSAGLVPKGHYENLALCRRFPSGKLPMPRAIYLGQEKGRMESNNDCRLLGSFQVRACV